VFYYSTDFFAAAGLATPAVGTLLASGVNLAATAAVLPLIETRGRRPLLLAGCAGMAAAALALTFAMVQLDARAPRAATDGTSSFGSGGGGVGGGGLLGWCAVAAVLLYVSAFEVGLGAIPWMITHELLPSSARDATLGLASGCNWCVPAWGGRACVRIRPLSITLLENGGLAPHCCFDGCF
jgi:SP family facilitated glucose transporter-like MFS transporter 8